MQISLPPSAGSDAFSIFALITDPKKYQTKMKELQDLQDTVAKEAEDLRTKVQAHTINVQDLETKKAEFKKDVDNTTVELEAQSKTLDQKIAEANANSKASSDIQATYTDLVQKKQPEVAAREVAVSVREQAVKLREEALAKAESSVSTLQNTLQVKLAKLKELI